jgi:hypothetical protein
MTAAYPENVYEILRSNGIQVLHAHKGPIIASGSLLPPRD